MSSSLNNVTCAGKDLGVVKAKYHLSQGVLRLSDLLLAQEIVKNKIKKNEINLDVFFILTLTLLSQAER